MTKPAFIAVFVLATLSCAVNPITSLGPIDEPHPGASGSQEMVLWVSPDGNDADPGTRDEPVQTIQLAINRMGLEFRESDDIPRRRYEVRVARGTYRPGAGLVDTNIGIYLGPWHTVDGFFDTLVRVSGGWDLETGTRADPSNPDELSELDGEGVLRHVLLVTRDDVQVSGFVITGGNAVGAPLGVAAENDPTAEGAPEAPTSLPYDDQRLSFLWTHGGGAYIAPGLDEVVISDVYFTENRASAPNAHAAFVPPRTNRGQRPPDLTIYLDASSATPQTVAGASGASISSY